MTAAKFFIIKLSLELYEFSFNNFYNNNGERYIGEFKKGIKDSINSKLII